ncbi:MAG TPA: succinate dehydrogenase iron-sulfur subunit [Polyangia bacterium]|jgi:succinate dehydrogenase / fumarate reductase iron-sulfur subunit
MSTVKLKVKRQDEPGAAPRWEEFEVPWEERLNVHAALMAVQRRPVTVDGRKTTPVVWDANCLEEVCGSCTMLINGRVMQACAALVDHLEQPIELRPMTKYPLIRDLAVDRSRIFEDFKKVHAWIDIDGTHDLGPGPRAAPELADLRYALSRCMACGCCMEACPNYGPQSPFIGAAPISQVRLMNLHPSGAMHADERLGALMEPGGVEGCGNAQNCVQVCPKEIPLTTSIADMMGATAKFALSSLFRRG